MQQLIGRLTQNAKVSQLKDGRKVTNFSLAINDSYKPKGSSEIKKIVTYIDCAYWLTDKVAPYLVKGSVIEVMGRIGVRAYINLQNEAKGTLTCHVQDIKIHSNAKGAGTTSSTNSSVTVPEETPDDLPF